MPNTLYNADFIFGYTGPESLSAELRAEAKRNLKLRDIELALAAFFSSLAVSENCTGVIAGVLPPGMREGAATAVTPAAPEESSDYWKGCAHLCCRYADRRTLLEVCGAILNSLPLQDWLTVSSPLLEKAVTFCRITPAASGRTAPVNCSGSGGYFSELEFEICVCVTPPEPELSGV